MYLQDVSVELLRKKNTTKLNIMQIPIIFILIQQLKTGRKILSFKRFIKKEL